MQVDLTQLSQSYYVQLLIYLLSPLIDIFLLIFMFIFNIIKRICWEVYLLFTRLPPTQAWMDPREQKLMIKYIQERKKEKK
jgi:hypothetical protein